MNARHKQPHRNIMFHPERFSDSDTKVMEVLELEDYFPFLGSMFTFRGAFLANHVGAISIAV